MHDPRISTALRQLADLDLGPDPGPPRWEWSVARVDAAGRIPFPAAARRALGVTPGTRTVLRGIGNRVSLVLAADCGGAPIVVDGRGRLRVPAWLRRGPGASMLVGTRYDAPVVVVAPVATLDGLGDLLSGSSQ
ncbi:MAG: AbrB/MazE/SpoVT family DNA-binding domain-containing protein [Acidimicrobiales bacterium]